MTNEQKNIIQSNVDYIFWILDYYQNELKEYLDDRNRDEMNSDFEECYKKLNEITEIIQSE